MANFLRKILSGKISPNLVTLVVTVIYFALTHQSMSRGLTANGVSSLKSLSLPFPASSSSS